MAKGHRCPLCSTFTFHNHCPDCGLTEQEAEQVLLKSLEDQGGNHE